MSPSDNFSQASSGESRLSSIYLSRKRHIVSQVSFQLGGLIYIREDVWRVT
jgi:hypothetical protein